jgi:hypothetical protein
MHGQMEGEGREATWNQDLKGVKGRAKSAANKSMAEVEVAREVVGGEEPRPDKSQAKRNREPKKWQLKGYTMERGRSVQKSEIDLDAHLRSCW